MGDLTKSGIKGKKRREKLKSLGLCVACGKNLPKEGINICESCSEKGRILSQKRYKNRVYEIGKCRECFESLPNDYILKTCQTCLGKGSKSKIEVNKRKKEKGICRSCPNLAVKGKRHCETCAAQSILEARQIREQRKQIGLCITCDAASVGGTFRCQACADSLNTKSRKRWDERRKQVFAHYGLVCSCLPCGETFSMMLTIDHIEDNGKEHRAETSGHVYKWLIENNFPEGFRTLCYNCNIARYKNGGICPHIS